MIAKDTIRSVVEKFGSEREHLMAILRELETLSERNVLAPTVLEGVAEEMNLPPSALAGFVDFYTMFKTAPRARYVIRVCKSTPCHTSGAINVLEAIGRLLGIREKEATADGMFYLETCECLGACSVAPAMMVNYDLHGNLTEERLASILQFYRAGASGDGEGCGPETSAAATIIHDERQTARLLAHIGRVDPGEIARYREAGGYTGLRRAVGMSPADVVAVVKDSGLRGRGGAGFPAGLKWSFVVKGPMQKYVICNADEGEPGTFKDRVLMEGDPHLLLEGMAICGFATDATVGYIYVRGEYRRSIDILQRAIDQARLDGCLGEDLFGSGFSFDVFIKEGGGAYVCGEETSLMNSMEGLRGYPRFKPPFPGQAGFQGSPSTVNNVETLMSVPMILQRGAEWFKEVGTLSCPGTKLFCLSGVLNRTGLVELPMGATLREIIDVYGRGLREGSHFKFAQVGGSAGGVLCEDLMDLPLDIDTPMKHGVTLGSGVVLVCDQTTCPVDFLVQTMSFFEHESCGQCVPCRVGTAQLHHTARRLAQRTAEWADVEKMRETAALMKKTSLCALGQSPIMPLETLVKNFPAEFEAHCRADYGCAACDRSLGRYYTASSH
ncbi:NAD(P)H-dependent oxidoreductase subunit E [Candidatus Fermentibacteria bacterium]|nr:NAD(P)H-dependent oxidoreductase subunit E [Candidatus Fermentibacteria bacterium]